ncbi:MAG TPA: META domain-containing protein [Cellulomonas sp.]
MDDVLGHTWEFTTVADEPVGDVPDRARPSLTFDGDGQVYGTGGVNRLRGTWQQDGRTLTFGPVATTLMAGAPEHMERERAVLALLAGPVTIGHDGPELLLTDADGQVSRLLPVLPRDITV